MGMRLRSHSKMKKLNDSEIISQVIWIAKERHGESEKQGKYFPSPSLILR